jgi:hypothetical protein
MNPEGWALLLSHFIEKGMEAQSGCEIHPCHTTGTWLTWKSDSDTRANVLKPYAVASQHSRGNNPGLRKSSC